MTKNFVALIAVFAVASLFAVDYTWIGKTPGSWNNEDNWQPNGIPGGGDMAYVPGETEFTDDIEISAGSLTVTSGVGTVSFKGVISGDGRLVLWGCGEKRLYRDNTYSGGTQVKGTGYRPDGTFIVWNGSKFGDSGAVRIYSGAALGTGTAVFDSKESKDSDGTLNNFGVRLYVEGDEKIVITTPLDIGFNRDGCCHIFFNAPECVFDNTIKVTGARLNIVGASSVQKCRFTLPLTVPGYFTCEKAHYYLDDTYSIGTINPYNGGKLHLKKSGKNTYWLRNGSTIVCEGNDVFDDSVPRIGDITAGSTLDLNGFNQTFRTFNSYAEKPNGDGHGIFSPVHAPAFLSFVGLEEGDRSIVFNGVLKGAAGLCWAPASPDSEINLCSTKASDTVGELVVSGGVMEVDCVMPLLSKVTVCEGATLRVGDSAFDGFASLVLEISSSGTLELGTGSTDGFKNFMSVVVVDENGNKTTLERGKVYSSSAAEGATVLPWLKGSAPLDLSDVSTTIWTAEGEGFWKIAANWNAGVPDKNRSAMIFGKDGEESSVVVDEIASVSNLVVRTVGSGMPKLTVGSVLASSNSTLVVHGSAAKIEVPEGGRFLYDGNRFAEDTSTESVSIVGGGELYVAGEAVFTNVTGSMVIGGDEGEVSKVSVAGNGVLNLNCKWEQNKVYGIVKLLKNGLIDVSGNGVLKRNCENSKEYFTWKQDGGNMVFRDSAVFSVGNVWENCFYPGETVFKDDARFETGSSPRIYFGAPGADKLCKVSFLGNSRYVTSTSGMSEFKPSNGGKVEVFFDSSAHHELGYLLVGRNNAGRTEITLKRGFLSVGSGSGLLLAGGAAMYANYSCVATGIVDVAGGVLRVNGSNGGSSKVICGFVVGDGKAQVGAPQAYGRINLSAGIVTNLHSQSMVVLGAGRACGEIVQTGGEFISLANAATCPMLVGLQGGVGLYALSNGVARVSGDIYVGGCSTNTLGRVFMEDRSGLTDCFGRISVVANDRARACEFHAGGRTVVGALGRGEIEVGAGGRFCGKDMVLSNATSSVLKIMVGDDGAGFVQLSGKLSVAPGAKLEIDTTFLAADRIRAPLLRFAELEGDFSPQDVAIIGTDKGRLRRRADGYDFVIAGGTQIILR